MISVFCIINFTNNEFLINIEKRETVSVCVYMSLCICIHAHTCTYRTYTLPHPHPFFFYVFITITKIKYRVLLGLKQKLLLWEQTLSELKPKKYVLSNESWLVQNNFFYFWCLIPNCKSFLRLITDCAELLSFICV